MKREIKERWVAALRSGEYTQTRGTLHDKEGYCCLGVLCDLAAKDGVVEGADDDEGIWHYGGQGETAVLPFEVASWAGLEWSNPAALDIDADGVGFEVELADYNDNGGEFDDIAEIIAKQEEDWDGSA